MITTVESLRDDASVALALARDRDLFLELLNHRDRPTRTDLDHCPLSLRATYISHHHTSECAILRRPQEG